MTTFAEAINEREARTMNDMKARATTANANVDLFFKIGASRGKDILPEFVAALVENPETACRILQWARDIRGGAGERQLFRNAIEYLANNQQDLARRLMGKIPILGRWDDLFQYLGTPLEDEAVAMLGLALENGDKLCAKWMPRKKAPAPVLARKLGLTPRQWRKLLVRNTNVVETLMCAKRWDEINFSHVPSLAHARYRKAFTKNAGEAYTKYVESLKKGDAKINANAVYPYDVIKNRTGGNLDVITAQWDALPNYLGDQKILAMVDTSASMTWFRVGGILTGRDIAYSLGLYVADKLTGPFKDLMLAFTTTADIMQLRGNILEKYMQIGHMPVNGSTNLHAAFQRVLDIATANNVAEEDMPDTIIIFSDMQFNACTVYDDNAIQMITRKYQQAGYQVPKIVFWNLNSYDNVPVKFNTKGVALVSGFSPAVMKSILSSQTFTPEAIMDEAIMVERYNF